MKSDKECYLTASQIRELLHYDDESGLLYWKSRRLDFFKPGKHQLRICNSWNSKFVGKAAGSVVNNGRLMVSVYDQDYLAHRVIWCLKTGEWPKNQIDHADGNPLNNRFGNFRGSTQAENTQNTCLYSNNDSGFRGVSWSTAHQKWLATIQVNRRQHYLGLFDSPAEAGAAYLKAKSSLHQFQPVPRLGVY